MVLFILKILKDKCPFLFPFGTQRLCIAEDTSKSENNILLNVRFRNLAFTNMQTCPIPMITHTHTHTLNIWIRTKTYSWLTKRTRKHMNMFFEDSEKNVTCEYLCVHVDMSFKRNIFNTSHMLGFVFLLLHKTINAFVDDTHTHTHTHIYIYIYIYIYVCVCVCVCVCFDHYLW